MDRIGTAVAVLALFWALMLASVWHKSLTTDEIVHATAGYTYWTYNDYRLNPENGNLPQRWMAIPLLGKHFAFPSTDSDAWRGADEWAMGDQWFHAMGNSVAAMLHRGRAMSALLAVALAALVWWYSRRIFGPRGGMISLVVCVLSPTILANGPLMTSDIACGLFFLAATMTWWDLLERCTWGRFAACAAATAGLFLSKMSAVLIVPIVIVLMAGRWWEAPVRDRRRKLLVFAGVAVAQMLVVYTAVWAAFGFRYSAFADGGPHHFYDNWAHIVDQPLLGADLNRVGATDAQKHEILKRMVAQGIPVNKWTPESLAFVAQIEQGLLTPSQAAHMEALMHAPPDAPIPRLLEAIRNHHLLPEAYVFGQAFSWKFSQKRGSFLNGHFGLFGWRWFFPYTVLVKTPLAFFALLLVAAWAAARYRRGGLAFACLPLWTLFFVYWAALIPSHINIGHRHILATYPPLFILAGAAGLVGRRGALLVGGLLCVQAAEVLGSFPDYIAYFNVLGGGESGAYRHLVDSSLDWGQDLPGVNRYIAEHHVTGPTYLSYFGTASPAYYHVPCLLLYSLQHPMQLFNVPAQDLAAETARLLAEHPNFEVAASGQSGSRAAVMLLERPEAFRLEPGTYFISATMLQPLEYDPPGPWGPWIETYEKKYQLLRPLAAPFLQGDTQAREAALRQGSVYDWMKALNDFDEFRFARLTAFLREREPNDTIGGSILVYRLSADDLARALKGPPPPYGPDVLGDLDRAQGAKKVMAP